jgi:hypothetical protein
MVTIYPRGLAFVAGAILILLAMDWFDLDWRVGLLAISIDALLTFVPFWGRGDSLEPPRSHGSLPRV